MATWNVNSIKARLVRVDSFLDRCAPDIVCVQETKVEVLPDSAAEMFERHGYQVTHVGARGGYNGVAVAARHPIVDVELAGGFGNEHLDREPRLAACVVLTPGGPVRAVSVYVPNGREIGHWHYTYKLDFFEALAARTVEWVATGVPLIVAGDMNVAATDDDVYSPQAFAGCTHVTAPERDALNSVLAAGVVDTDAACWGAAARRWTWWNYVAAGYARNRGLRIDVLAASADLVGRLDTTWVDHVERGAERPSDHAAVVADFTLPAPRLD